jgi:hypothetical protein
MVEFMRCTVYVVVEISHMYKVLVLHPSYVPAKVCVNLKRRYLKMTFSSEIIGWRNRTQPSTGCQTEECAN